MLTEAHPGPGRHRFARARLVKLTAVPRTPAQPRKSTGVALAGLLLTATLPASATDPPTGFDREPFAELATESGLEFTHFNGMSGNLYLLEVAGSGVAFLDYDRDGDLDVYLVQGGRLGPPGAPESALEKPLFPPPEGTPPGDRLFRNDLERTADGAPRPRFVDVTAASGIDATGYGMGVTVGDPDGDGWPDLYLTNFGPNQLWQNRGDGTFADVTAASGTDDPRWSVPAAFIDLDGDGRQDLWIGNYVDFRFGVPGLDHHCPSETGAPDYCGPLAYKPVTDRLLKNLGDGTFVDVTRRAGVDRDFGGALGVAAADFDGDGRQDLYVANDMTPNQLWLNQGDGAFRNEALFAGSAVNWEGKPEASMGVAVGDFDGDGDEDLFMTHLQGETNTLYVNNGEGFFSDQTLASGLANPSWDATAFGTAWLDFDLDLDLDLVAVNGAVRKIEAQIDAGDPLPLRQPNQLFRNLGDGRYEEIVAPPGSAFTLSEVSRGAAVGDVDNDGDPDLAISNNNGPARLLVNRLSGERAWLGLRLGSGTGAEAILAPVTGPTARRRARAGGSYGSSHDPRVLFGLGDHAPPVPLSVRWPSGRRQRWLDLEAGRYYLLPEPPAGGISVR